MKYSDINIFCCLKCRGRLRFFKISEKEQATQEALAGAIACAHCNSTYPIIKSIPRFANRDNYASSFGYQWKKFSRTQFGEKQKQITKLRFYQTTKWPDHLQGQLILEAGSGMGRFSEIVLDAQAEVYSFDLSAAVWVAKDNLKPSALKCPYYLFQADIYKIPLPYEMFDKIFCFGVLQHCPDLKKAYLSLVPFLKPGGELVIDCYLRQPLKDRFNLKYLLRPFFKGWRPAWLFAFCAATISLAYDTKSFLRRIPLVGKFISNLIPIGQLNYAPDYYFSLPEIKEIKTLSMFDMLSPKYDKPQRISDFRLWIQEAGLEILELTKGFNGINARARKPPKGIN